MAKRIKSGLKDLRKSARRGAANVAVKSKLKTLVRAATRPGETGAAQAETIGAAQAALDKAAARRVIHPNTAARRKSRMMRRAAATPG